MSKNTKKNRVTQPVKKVVFGGNLYKNSFFDRGLNKKKQPKIK